MHNPLVSVIIPNYCHARYLNQRIQSVLNQTYQEFEVIILDDCSPDEGASKAVIEKYRDNPHVSHIVYNAVNSGSTFKQWNKGISLAKGELIWIAESDDYCEPTLLERTVSILANDSTCSLSFCRTKAFNENGETWLCWPESLATGIYKGTDFIHDYMSIGNGIVNASAVIFRKQAAETVPTDYMTYKGAGDRLFWIYLLETGNVGFVNEVLNHFRNHTLNTTKSKNKAGSNQREDKKILDYIFKKGYISYNEYEACKKKYVRTMIFEMIGDKDLKRDLYKVWEYGKLSQLMLRLEAWGRKIGL